MKMTNELYNMLKQNNVKDDYIMKIREILLEDEESCFAGYSIAIFLNNNKITESPIFATQREAHHFVWNICPDKMLNGGEEIKINKNKINIFMFRWLNVYDADRISKGLGLQVIRDENFKEKII